MKKLQALLLILMAMIYFSLPFIAIQTNNIVLGIGWFLAGFAIYFFIVMKDTLQKPNIHAQQLKNNPLTPAYITKLAQQTGIDSTFFEKLNATKAVIVSAVNYEKPENNGGVVRINIDTKTFSVDNFKNLASTYHVEIFETTSDFLDTAFLAVHKDLQDPFKILRILFVAQPSIENESLYEWICKLSQQYKTKYNADLQLVGVTETTLDIRIDTITSEKDAQMIADQLGLAFPLMHVLTSQETPADITKLLLKKEVIQLHWE